MEPGTKVDVLVGKDWKPGTYLREDSECAYVKCGDANMSLALTGKGKTWRLHEPPKAAPAT